MLKISKKKNSKNSGFTPTPILKRMSGILTNFNFLSPFNYQSIKSVGIGVSLRSKRGFTLVELLVTISMFVIVTGVVLVNSNKFSSTILLNNFAYDVALTIKQAQTYGVNVRESVSGSFNAPYGVYFDIGPGGSINNFILFNDIAGAGGFGPSNKIYDDSQTPCSASNLECLQKYSMTKGTYIKSLCAGLNEMNCASADQLSILFERPDPGAKIYYKTSSGLLSGPESYAKIVLSAVDNATSTVIVTKVGQIYVKKN